MNYLYKIFFFFTILHYAQSPVYQEKWLNNEESGLPQNTIKSMVKDRFGFLWLSTEKGLIRYDGHKFVTYQPNVPNVENRTVLIGGDADDDFLFTYYNSVKFPVLISGRTCKTLNMQSPYYKEIKKYSSEYLIRMLGHRNYSSRLYFHYFISRKEGYCLRGDRLFYYVGRRERFIRAVKSYSYLNFAVSGENLIYMDSPEMISMITKDGKIKRFVTGLKKQLDYCLYVNYGNKQVFVRNANKIYIAEYLNGRMQLIEVYNDPQSSRKILYKCMYYDKHTRMLFVGTLDHGILIVKKKFIKAFTIPFAESTVLNAIDRYSDHELITASGDILDTRGNIRKLFSRKSTENYGVLYLKDKSGMLIKEFWEIYLYNKSGKKLIKDFGYEQRVTAINYGNKGKIWISASCIPNPVLGYIKIHKGTVTEHKFYKIFQKITGILELDNGNLLMSSENGIHIFNEKTKTIKTFYRNVLFRSLNENGDNNIWIESYGDGLYLYRNGKIYPPPPNKKRMLSDVHCVIGDDYGHYWMSSNDGLFQVHKKEFIDYYMGKLSDIYIQQYDKNDGLLSNEFNGGANINGLKIGKYVCFPSLNGIVFIDTKNAFSVFPEENFYTDRMLINDKEMLIGNNRVSLNRNFRYLKIFVDHPNYGNENNDLIHYRIDNAPWISLSEDNAVNINKLSYGDHEIHFRKLKNFGTDYTYKTLSIFVEPAFWETLFFKIAASAVLIGMFYLFYKRRLKKIELEKIILGQKIEQHTAKLNDTIRSLSATREELYAQLYRQKKLVTVISHDIKSPLKFINMSTEYLLENNSTEQELHNVLISIKDSCGKMIDFIESSLTYSKVFIYDSYTIKEDIILHEFMDQRIRIFKNIAEFNAITLINRIDPGTLIRSNADVLHIVVHNIVDNAIKYTKKGNVTVYSSSDKDGTKLIFEDTGIGMTPEEIRRITGGDVQKNTQVGMRIVNELLALVNVPMEIESDKNKGTRIILTFKNEAIQDLDS
ncbi:ATP-binding protein [uncultured Chryseobacterium sp.]|uniref:sensor histidine kinase n=1 Tax=uncultured Chryseobacterium sp. TaxID=259322 RepID=UPI0025CF7B00|nr:ATP-binding protein [uncultured Chryseobacterium sp.]